MLSSTMQLVTLALALAPSLASAALFPKDSQVKMLDAKAFKKAMKVNQTSLVAFVAPWCGHCQRMAPEFSRAALGLYPLVPLYAIDCDDEKNKRLCAEQDVRGFPTVKLFPRGNSIPPMVYDSGERTASAFFYWASRRIPNTVTKLYHVEDIPGWVEKQEKKYRALLLTKDKKVPLLWKVLGNKYMNQIEFASHRDRKGKSSVKLGYEAGEKKQPKVLVYAPGSTKAFRYEGINKLDSLSKFFDSVLDGSVDISVVNEEAKKEEFEPTEEELEIERKQEAQRIALAHGGFADLIDFEEAIKNGGANFHDTHGFGGGMGDIPYKKKPSASGSAADAPETPKTPVVESTPAPATPAPTATPETQEEVKQVVLETTEPSPSPEAAKKGSESATTPSEPAPSTEAEHPKDEL
ncbi:hypothetical protein HGRIS_005279 [Hohenbuehelia grisea]|uniref:Thioredoxin domain-containing protein n=1 Tax=Hohenbuehelia grisea TaxID=104357 RepID=A0ABR3JEK3_9AGAR